MRLGVAVMPVCDNRSAYSAAWGFRRVFRYIPYSVVAAPLRRSH